VFDERFPRNTLENEKEKYSGYVITAQSFFIQVTSESLLSR
jgi:hypothetical protein